MQTPDSETFRFESFPYFQLVIAPKGIAISKNRIFLFLPIFLLLVLSTAILLEYQPTLFYLFYTNGYFISSVFVFWFGLALISAFIPFLWQRRKLARMSPDQIEDFIQGVGKYSLDKSIRKVWPDIIEARLDRNLVVMTLSAL